MKNKFKKLLIAFLVAVTSLAIVPGFAEETEKELYPVPNGNFKAATFNDNYPQRIFSETENLKWPSSMPQTKNQWAIINLNDVYSVSKIEFNSGALYPRYAKIYTSCDDSVYNDENAEAWGDELITLNNDTDIMSFEFESRDVKYIMIKITKSFYSSTWAVGDFKVYSETEYPAVEIPENIIDTERWTVSASSDDGVNIAENAVDGNPATKWSSEATVTADDYFMIDLGKNTGLEKIMISNDAAYMDGAPTAISVFTSNDEVWENPGSESWNVLSEDVTLTNPIVLDASGISARYIMIKPSETEKYTWIINDIYVSSNERTVANPIKLDRSKWTATTPSTYGDWTGDKMFDGLGGETLRWSSGELQAAGQSIMVDMNEVQYISILEMNNDYVVGADRDGGFPEEYSVSVSQYGDKFTEVARGNGDYVTQLAFQPVLARYVKITITKPKETWWNIHELNIYKTIELVDNGFYKNGVKVSEANSTDCIEFNADFVNESTETATVQFIISILKGDKIIACVTEGSKELSLGENSLGMTVDLSEYDGVTEVRGFIWDSVKSRNPYILHSTLKVN